jgi:hypothetical protein
MPTTLPPAITQAGPTLSYDIVVFGRPEVAATREITETIREPAADLAAQTDGLVSNATDEPVTADAERAFDTLQRSQREAARAQQAASVSVTWAPR